MTCCSIILLVAYVEFAVFLSIVLHLGASIRCMRPRPSTSPQYNSCINAQVLNDLHGRDLGFADASDRMLVLRVWGEWADKPNTFWQGTVGKACLVMGVWFRAWAKDTTKRSGSLQTGGSILDADAVQAWTGGEEEPVTELQDYKHDNSSTLSIHIQLCV